MTPTQARMICGLLFVAVLMLATLVLDGAHRDADSRARDLVEQVRSAS